MVFFVFVHCRSPAPLWRVLMFTGHNCPLALLTAVKSPRVCVCDACEKKKLCYVPRVCPCLIHPPPHIGSTFGLFGGFGPSCPSGRFLARSGGLLPWSADRLGFVPFLRGSLIRASIPFFCASVSFSLCRPTSIFPDAGYSRPRRSLWCFCGASIK